MNSPSKSIIFFDGVCNLCNGFVDFVISRDLRGKYQFAPLQGTNAKSRLSSKDISQLGSVVLWQNNETLYKSDAALKIIVSLGGLWGLANVFWIVPKFLRDIVYDLVASNRYSLFGRRNTCRLPTESERARFLD